jgi:FkbM family methyltransferase
MPNLRRKVISQTKSGIRSAIDQTCRLFPAILGRVAYRLLTNAAILEHLPARAVAQLRQTLVSSDETGYRQECFSQEGEDLVVARMIGERANGFYVDVGAHHPIKYSNTFLLYKRGWRGINIDATPGSMALFDQLRPRDINIERLIASDPSPHTFHLFNEPALNTASSVLAKLRPSESDSFKIIETVTLTPNTLASILDEHMPRDQLIDVMSIDVEGFDLDVLASNDWDRYRPALLLIELLDTKLHDLGRHEIARFLGLKDYHPVSKIYNTVIFQTKRTR